MVFFRFIVGGVEEGFGIVFLVGVRGSGIVFLWSLFWFVCYLYLVVSGLSIEDFFSFCLDSVSGERGEREKDKECFGCFMLIKL